MRETAVHETLLQGLIQTTTWCKGLISNIWLFHVCTIQILFALSLNTCQSKQNKFNIFFYKTVKFQFLGITKTNNSTTKQSKDSKTVNNCNNNVRVNSNKATTVNNSSRKLSANENKPQQNISKKSAIEGKKSSTVNKKESTRKTSKGILSHPW